MIRENKPFIEGLVAAVPELVAMRDKHLADNFGEFLPHVLVADLEGWAEMEVAAGRIYTDAPLRRLLAYFEEVYASNQEPLVNDPPANVIAVSFVEMIPALDEPGGELRTILGPVLRELLG